MSKASQIWWSVMTFWQEAREVGHPRKTSQCVQRSAEARAGTLFSRNRNWLRGLVKVARAEAVDAELGGNRASWHTMAFPQRKLEAHGTFPVTGFLEAFSEDGRQLEMQVSGRAWGGPAQGGTVPPLPHFQTPLTTKHPLTMSWEQNLNSTYIGTPCIFVGTYYSMTCTNVKLYVNSGKSAPCFVRSLSTCFSSAKSYPGQPCGSQCLNCYPCTWISPYQKLLNP